MLAELLPPLGWAILVLDVLAIILVVFVERKDATSVAPWVLTILFLPVAGLLLYMLFGFHYFKEHEFQAKRGRDRAFLDQLVEAQRKALRAERKARAPAEEPFVGLARMLLMDNEAFVTANNRVDTFTDGKAKFEALFADIARAKHHIHLQYYILRNDDLAKELLQRLAAKAKEGVEVRLLYDDLGNKVPPRGYRELLDAGGAVSAFYHAPIPFLGPRMNYRNHRKIAVIDGAVGFTGGFNVGKEYLGQGPLGPWRDTAVRIDGDGAKGLQVRFVNDWNYATDEGVGFSPEYFPTVPAAGDAAVQVVAGGPDTPWSPIKQQYLKMIGAARKHVYIETPYFIPDESCLDALRIAALSGVDVRIIVPRAADAPLVKAANRAFLGELLQVGVRAYLYRPGFLHAKTITVDDVVSSVGSANWDIRSFKWNFECNAVVHGSAFAQEQRRIFERDLAECTELTLAAYAARPRLEKAQESFSRVFASVL